MKFLSALAITAAALTAAPAAYSSVAEQDALNCKRVRKDAVEVCKSFNAHHKVLYALDQQLAADRNSTRNTRTQFYAARDLSYSVFRNNKVTNVAKHAKKVEKSAAALLKQLAPLAEEWANYEELQEQFTATYTSLIGNTSSWMKQKTRAVNCDKMDSSVQNICVAYKKHAAAVDTYIAQLKADELTPKYAEAHIDAVVSIMRAIGEGKSKTRVKGKLGKVSKTTTAVLNQIGPLAEEWDNYAEMAKSIVKTKAAFDKALNNWIEG